MQFYELALQQPEIDKAPLLKGHALANYGELLRRQASPEQAGSLDKAESTLKSALALIERNGRPEDARRALTSLARIKAQRSQTDEALALYARAIVLYRKAGDERGEARAQLGRGYVELGRNRIQSAADAYQRALELAVALRDDDLLWQAHLGLGRTYKARGDLDKAASEYSASLEFIGNREGDLATDEGKVTFVQQAQDAFNQLLLVQLERGARDPARYADALAVAEESRARSLFRLMQGWTGDARPSPASLGLTACYRPPRPPRPPRSPQAQAECDAPRVGRMNQMARATAASPRRLRARRDALVPAQIAIANAQRRSNGGWRSRRSGVRQPRAPTFSSLRCPPAQRRRRQGFRHRMWSCSALPRLVFHVLEDRVAVFAVGRDGRVVGAVVRMTAESLTQRVASATACARCRSIGKVRHSGCGVAPESGVRAGSGRAAGVARALSPN